MTAVWPDFGYKLSCKSIFKTSLLKWKIVAVTFSRELWKKLGYFLIPISGHTGCKFQKEKMLKENKMSPDGRSKLVKMNEPDLGRSHTREPWTSFWTCWQRRMVRSRRTRADTWWPRCPTRQRPVWPPSSSSLLATCIRWCWNKMRKFSSILKHFWREFFLRRWNNDIMTFTFKTW